MQAIRCGTRAEADGFAARVDAALGYPRCERLAGTLVVQRAVTCPCVSVSAPHASCLFATFTKAKPTPLRSGAFAYPVADAAARAALTAGERARIEEINGERAGTPTR